MKRLIAEVTGTEEFDEDVFHEKIDHIVVIFVKNLLTRKQVGAIIVSVETKWRSYYRKTTEFRQMGEIYEKRVTETVFRVYRKAGYSD